MSSSNRQTSLSPSEQQRSKSRSASRSHRTPSNIIGHEENTRHEKTSKRTTRETNPTKHSESSAINQSIKTTSSISKKQKSKTKTSKSPSPNRKERSKRKKTPTNTNETDTKQVSQPNDAERQDLTARGFSFVPAEIFERMRHLLFFP